MESEPFGLDLEILLELEHILRTFQRASPWNCLPGSFCTERISLNSAPLKGALSQD